MLANDRWWGIVGNMAGKVRLVIKLQINSPLVERRKVMTLPLVGKKFSVKSTS